MLKSKVTINYDKSTDIALDCFEFTLNPNEAKNLLLTYKPKDAGVFNGVLEV